MQCIVNFIKGVDLRDHTFSFLHLLAKAFDVLNVVTRPLFELHVLFDYAVVLSRKRPLDLGCGRLDELDCVLNSDGLHIVNFCFV